MDWQPSCSLELLRNRASLFQKIRQFFAEKSVLEVETPLLCSAIGTDPNLDFFTTQYNYLQVPQHLFLQTSPEFAMKRLLAAGFGSIYQICKAFRNGESGRFHNPEFTLLEWYRVGYDLSQLMDEIAELMQVLFSEYSQLKRVQRVAYESLFMEYTGLNALAFSFEKYCQFALANGLADAKLVCGQDHTLWLDFIFSHKIQPQLELDTLWLVHGYPACLPSLARTNLHNSLIVDRVEVFLNGVELGNGYYELEDAKEQERRFDKDIAIRKETNRPIITKDMKLLAALQAGLPDCSGIAIGLDRILMLLSNSRSIDDVLAFPVSKT
jgi:lysyl-tRNA synthetase class 2